MFFHFVLANFSNTYILGPAEGGSAVIIDPGVMDIALLKLIEQNRLYIKDILVTHNHSSHVNGIKTLMKIYDARVFSNRDLPFDCMVNYINDGDILHLDNHKVSVFNVPGHSPDSMIFHINNMLFTGDVLLCGKIDNELSDFARTTLKENIRSKIFCLEDDVLIFPGHGAPTTVLAEKLFNPDLQGL